MEPLVSVLWGHSRHWITFCAGTFNPVSQASGNKETLRFRLGSENHDSNFMTGNTIQTVFLFPQAQVSSLRSPSALCWVLAGTYGTDSQRPDCHRARALTALIPRGQTVTGPGHLQHWFPGAGLSQGPSVLGMGIFWMSEFLHLSDPSGVPRPQLRHFLSRGHLPNQVRGSVWTSELMALTTVPYVSELKGTFKLIILIPSVCRAWT